MCIYWFLYFVIDILMLSLLSCRRHNHNSSITQKWTGNQSVCQLTRSTYWVFAEHHPVNLATAEAVKAKMARKILGWMTQWKEKNGMFWLYKFAVRFPSTSFSLFLAVSFSLYSSESDRKTNTWIRVNCAAVLWWGWCIRTMLDTVLDLSKGYRRQRARRK